MSVLMPGDGTVMLSHAVVEGLERGTHIPVFTTHTVDLMAWILCLARELEDTEVVFPRGKWATIQVIESQIQVEAAYAVRRTPPPSGEHLND